MGYFYIFRDKTFLLKLGDLVIFDLNLYIKIIDNKLHEWANFLIINIMPNAHLFPIFQKKRKMYMGKDGFDLHRSPYFIYLK